MTLTLLIAKIERLQNKIYLASEAQKLHSAGGTQKVCPDKDAFVGSAHSFEILGTDKKGAAILKTFYINDTKNVNKWRAGWEGLKQDAKELFGVPIVLKEDLEHPKFSVQDNYEKGAIFAHEVDEANKQIIAYAKITDKKTVERIKSGELQYVSPAVIPRSKKDMHKVDGVDVLDRTLPLHLAIVGNPAYGTDKAKMTHVCEGDEQQCFNKLKKLTS